MMRVLHIDIETTGLDFNRSSILQVAACVHDLKADATGPVFNMYTSLDARTITRLNWDRQALAMHRKSGVLSKCEQLGKGNESLIDDELHRFIIDSEAEGLPPCGFSVHFDVRFLRKFMPRSANLFHGHRIVDLSGFKMMHSPELPGRGNLVAHDAADDVQGGIDFLRQWYLDMLAGIDSDVF